MMSDDPSYILDIQGLTLDDRVSDAAGGERRATQGTDARGRKWIGVQFECCGVYSRIYKNPSGTAYVGVCPRCQRRVNIGIGPGGTNSRMFRAT